MTGGPRGTPRTKMPPLDERDHALIAEVIGYLRALHAVWDDGNSDTERVLASPAAYVQALARRMRNLECKCWPIL